MSASAANLGSAAADFTSALGDVFGTSGTSSGSGTGSSSSKTLATEAGSFVEQLEISEEGILKILNDILGSEQGLANVFSEENVAGIFNSTVSKQAAGDLITNLAGELAKLTAKKTQSSIKDTASSTEGESESTSSGTQGTDGLLEQDIVSDVISTLSFGLF